MASKKEQGEQFTAYAEFWEFVQGGVGAVLLVLGIIQAIQIGIWTYTYTRDAFIDAVAVRVNHHCPNGTSGMWMRIK